MSFKCLSTAHKLLLAKADITDVSQLLLAQPLELAQKLKVSVNEIQFIIDTISQDIAPEPRKLQALQIVKTLSTGDERLDQALGGGIYPGLLTELVGEGAAGKTQIALQLSLSAQLSDGLCGSTCYLTTVSFLPTIRLNQMIECNPKFSQCTLSDIHTSPIQSPQALIHTFTHTLPELIAKLKHNRSKPIKLIVLDSLASLFRDTFKATTASLFERSKLLFEISAHLHAFAAKGMAVIVLNDVTDVFAHQPSPVPENGIIYREQAKWFNRAWSLPGEDAKEARLGLIWANQVNVRVMVSRTGRRRHMAQGNDEHRHKRTRLSNPIQEVDETLIRRLSIIFSATCAPSSLDFVVIKTGVMTLPEESAPISFASDTTMGNVVHIDEEEWAMYERMWAEATEDDDVIQAAAINCSPE